MNRQLVAKKTFRFTNWCHIPPKTSLSTNLYLLCFYNILVGISVWLIGICFKSFHAHHPTAWFIPQEVCSFSTEAETGSFESSSLTCPMPFNLCRPFTSRSGLILLPASSPPWEMQVQMQLFLSKGLSVCRLEKCPCCWNVSDIWQ